MGDSRLLSRFQYDCCCLASIWCFHGIYDRHTELLFCWWYLSVFHLWWLWWQAVSWYFESGRCNYFIYSHSSISLVSIIVYQNARVVVWAILPTQLRWKSPCIWRIIRLGRDQRIWYARSVGVKMTHDIAHLVIHSTHRGCLPPMGWPKTLGGGRFEMPALERRWPTHSPPIGCALPREAGNSHSIAVIRVTDWQSHVLIFCSDVHKGTYTRGTLAIQCLVAFDNGWYLWYTLARDLLNRMWHMASKCLMVLLMGSCLTADYEGQTMYVRYMCVSSGAPCAQSHNNPTK